MKINVLKRDGSIQPYNQKKIAKVATAAGLSSSQADKLSSEVTLWVISKKENPISTHEIRDKVVENLQQVKPSAADLYLWYEKTKKNFLKK